MIDPYMIGLGLIAIWATAETTWKYPPFGVTGAAGVSYSVGAVAVLLGFGL